MAGTKKPADLMCHLHVSGRPNTNPENEYNVSQLLDPGLYVS